MKTLAQLTAFVIKDIRQALRSRAIVAILIAYPFFTLFIVAHIFNFGLDNLNIATVDMDGSSISRRIVNGMENSDELTLAAACTSYDDAYELLWKGTVDCIVVIPPDFESSVAALDPQQIQVVLNAVNTTKGTLGSKYVSGNILTTLSHCLEEYGVSTSGTETISESYLYNPSSDYILFMVPTVLLTIAIALCTNLTGTSMSNEKNSGTLDLLNVSPMKKSTLVSAKILTCYLFSLLEMAVVLFIGKLAYGIPPMSAVFPIFIIYSLFMWGIAAFSVIVSNFTESTVQILLMVSLTTTILQMMSGAYTPVRSMPRWLQAINCANPAQYLISSLRSVYLKGARLSDLTLHISVLLASAAILWSTAILTYKKRSL